jgi:hypothetical protein
VVHTAASRRVLKAHTRTVGDHEGIMSPAASHWRTWGWFAAWFGVGIGYAFSVIGALTVGPYLLPLPVALTILLLRRPATRVGLPGLVSGLSFPVFYVAYLNRGGPGDVCSTTGSGQSCTTEWNPWPWVAVAVLLLALGAVVIVIQQHRHDDLRSTAVSEAGSSTLEE